MYKSSDFKCTGKMGTGRDIDTLNTTSVTKTNYLQATKIKSLLVRTALIYFQLDN